MPPGPTPLARVGKDSEPGRVFGIAKVAVALPGDALRLSAVGAAVDPAEREEGLRAFRRLDADGGAERMPGHPLSREVAGEDLSQPATRRVAILAVLLQALDQVGHEEQLDLAEGQPNPMCAERLPEVVRGVAEFRRSRFPQDVAEEGRDEAHRAHPTFFAAATA